MLFLLLEANRDDGEEVRQHQSSTTAIFKYFQTSIKRSQSGRPSTAVVKDTETVQYQRKDYLLLFGIVFQIKNR